MEWQLSLRRSGSGGRVVAVAAGGPGGHADWQALPRHSVAAAQLEEKLAGAQRQLGQLRAQEAGLQREQRKADTHRKMTEF